MFAALHLFCLLSALALTKQESVSLEVSPVTLAECGEQVSLNCSTSSSHDGLSVKHMEWSRGSLPLCSVRSNEDVITHKRHSLSDFYCTYQDGQLSLVFQRMLPLESGDLNRYRCKLHSNQGVAHNYTTVELQEFYGEVESVLTSDGPSCTFSHVYPDGDVFWFHDSQDLSDGSVNQSTSKTVDEHGWLTIRSWLSSSVKQEWGSSGKPYNCSLQSSTSGRILTSALVPDMTQNWRRSTSDGNGVKSHKTMTTVFSILVSLVVTGK